MKLLYNIILALLGFGAIILEFFVPSAGIIGLIGGGCVIAGIVFTYLNYGRLAGSIFLLVSAIIGPIIVILYFKLFPGSIIGKRLILKNEFKQSEGFTAGKKKNISVGDRGKTTTKLRPVGSALINNELVDVTTDGEFIDKDSDIEVVEIDGNRIIVSNGGSR